QGAGPGVPAGAAGGPDRTGGRMQKVLAISGGAIALVLAVTLTYAFTRHQDSKDEAAKDKQTSSPDSQASARPQASGQNSTGPASTAPTDTGTGGVPASGDYQVVFQDRTLTVRPPNSLDSGPDVDLDQPKVDPQHTLQGGEVEFSYGDDYLNFDTPMGKSPSADPAACKAAAESAPLPTQVEAKQLVGQDPLIKVGDRLCTVTSDGRLAMWTITETEPTENFYKTPVYTGKLTLWKIPAGS
ncbi:MAG: hypothetical protein HOY69_07680, partial [Streptomyces sp.]|nr:hypothetical protein [Streptomyces sp.]